MSQRVPWEDYSGYGEPVTTYEVESPDGETEATLSTAESESTTALVDTLARGGWTVTATTEGRV